MERLPYKRLLVRTFVTEDGDHPLMYLDLSGEKPVIEPFGGVERHSTVFIDGRVALIALNPESSPEPFLL